MSLAALAVMAGHAYPVFLGFKGGKAVASFVGAFLCLTPLALAAELMIFRGCSGLDAVYFAGFDRRRRRLSRWRSGSSCMRSVTGGAGIGGSWSVHHLQA